MSTEPNYCEHGLMWLHCHSPEPELNVEAESLIPAEAGIPSPSMHNEMTFEQQKEVTTILENYRRNPSNSNKFRFELFAYIDALIQQVSDQRVREFAARLKQYNGAYIGINGRRVGNMVHHTIIDQNLEYYLSHKEARDGAQRG